MAVLQKSKIRAYVSGKLLSLAHAHVDDPEGH